MIFAAKEKIAYKITIRTSPTQEKNYKLCSQEKKELTKSQLEPPPPKGKTMSFAAKEKKSNLQNHNKNLPHPGKKTMSFVAKEK